MNKWKCNFCHNEIDKFNKARHSKSQKHLSINNLNNFQNQEQQQNDIFQFDDLLFEPTNKQKKIQMQRI
jgi:hypothetical protein